MQERLLLTKKEIYENELEECIEQYYKCVDIGCNGNGEFVYAYVLK